MRNRWRPSALDLLLMGRAHVRIRVLEPIVFDKPEEVKQFLDRLAWAEVPVREANLERGERFLELETKDGQKVEVTFLQTGKDNELVGVFFAPMATADGDGMPRFQADLFANAVTAAIDT